MSFELTAPRMATLIISVVMAVVAVVVHYANIANPVTHSGFVILLLAYVVLLAGNLVRGV